MTLSEIRQCFRECAAHARRELYMTCDRDSADRWAKAAERWLWVLQLQIEQETAQDMEQR